MNNILLWIDKQVARLVRGYQFINYILYYMGRGHSLKNAVSLAHRVVQ